jgi:hypothetical protein
MGLDIHFQATVKLLWISTWDKDIKKCWKELEIKSRDHLMWLSLALPSHNIRRAILLVIV